MSETIVAVTSVTYAPASNSTDSLTMYFELDGQRHALIGARGTWSDQRPTVRASRTCISHSLVCGSIR
jgi:hypothetical protein